MLLQWWVNLWVPARVSLSSTVDEAKLAKIVYWAIDVQVTWHRRLLWRIVGFLLLLLKDLVFEPFKVEVRTDFTAVTFVKQVDPFCASLIVHCTIWHLFSWTFNRSLSYISHSRRLNRLIIRDLWDLKAANGSTLRIQSESRSDLCFLKLWAAQTLIPHCLSDIRSESDDLIIVFCATVLIDRRQLHRFFVRSDRL